MAHFVSATRRELGAYADSFRHFSPNARFYLLATIFVALGIAIQNVLYNLYLIRLGFDETLVGQVSTAVALGVAVCGIPVGLVYDRVGGKLTFGLSVVGMAITMTLRALSQDPSLMILWAALNGAANSLYFVSIFPFLTGQSSQRERPHLIGSNMAVWTGLTMLGSFLAGFLPNIWVSIIPSLTDLGGLQASLVTAAVLVAIGAIPLNFFRVSKMTPERQFKRSWLPQATSRSAIFSAALVLGLTGLIIGLTAPFMNVYLKKVFLASTASIGTIFSLSQFMGLLSAFLSPILVQKLGLTVTPTLLMLLNAPFIFCIGLPIPLVGAAAAFLLSVGFERMGDVPLMNLVMIVVPTSERGAMSGIRLITNYGAQALAGILGGLIIINAGYGWLFSAAAILSVVAGASVWFLFHKRKNVLETA